MTLRTARSRVLFLALAILLAAARAPEVSAMGPSAARIELRVPPAATAGERLALEARLADARGTPIAGAPVVFSSRVEFAGVAGEVKRGEALTDKGGVATLSYVPRQEGGLTLIARFAGSREHGPGRAAATLSIRPGLPLYQEKPWIRVPGIIWVLMALLGAVWAIYLTVMILLVSIAHEGRPAASKKGR